MTTQSIRFERLHEDVMLPRRASRLAAGYDLRAYLTGTRPEFHDTNQVVPQDPVLGAEKPYIDLPAGVRAKVPLGFRSQLPENVEAQIRPRSGTSFKTDLHLANAPGTIDADYRGEWMVLVRNLGKDPMRIYHGDAIAQVVFAAVLHLPIMEGALEDTERGAGGFGSTGS
jgi:dUTP pyrophosphatase